MEKHTREKSIGFCVKEQILYCIVYPVGVHRSLFRKCFVNNVDMIYDSLSCSKIYTFVQFTLRVSIHLQEDNITDYVVKFSACTVRSAFAKARTNYI